MSKIEQSKQTRSESYQVLQEVDRKQNVWCGNETPFLKKYVKSSVDEGIVFLAGVKGWKTPLCVPVS